MKIIAFWKPFSGNNSNTGDSWDQSKLTYPGIEALLTNVPGTMIAVLGGNGVEVVRENITPADYKRGIIVGESKNQTMYWIGGADDSGAMINLSGANKYINLCDVTLIALNGSSAPILNKPYIALGGGALELSGESTLILTGDGQTGIRINDYLIGNPIQGVRFGWGIGTSYAASYYIQCNKTTSPTTPILVRNCMFLYADSGVTGITEPMIYNLGGGAVDCCKFYNCAWVKIDALGRYTLMTEKNTYPSGASVGNRDPEPMQTLDWFRILPSSSAYDDTVLKDILTSGFSVLTKHRG